MSLNIRLQRLLDQSGADYAVLTHREACTARGAAHNAHIATGELAKVVVVRNAPHGDLMLVLPASRRMNDQVVRCVTGALFVRLEDEVELRELFPDCEVGAMPPFGHLYGLPMFLDPCLADHEFIWFEGGNHHQLVKMSYYEYERLARPYCDVFCLHAAGVPDAHASRAAVLT